MAPAAAEDDELWEVSLAPGERRVMTLEQLDDAFRLSVVNESTLVRQGGSEEWQPLWVVAGLEEPEELTTRMDVKEVAALAAAVAPPPAPPASKMKATVMGLGPGGYGVAPPPPGMAAPTPVAAPPRPSGPPPLPPNAFASLSNNKAATPVALSVPAPLEKSPRASKAPGLLAPPRMQAPRPLGARTPQAAPPPLPGPPSDRAGGTSPGQEPSSARPVLPRIAPAQHAATSASSGRVASSAPPAQARIAPAPRAAPAAPSPVASSVPPALPKIAPVRRAATRALPEPVPAVAQSLPDPASASPPALRPTPARPPAVPAAPALPRIPPAPAAASRAELDPSTLGGAPQASGGISGAELWVFAAAILLGLFVTAQRHGLLEKWARSFNAESGYAAFDEAVFGGPSLNTPRGVKQLIEKQRAADSAAKKEALNR